MIGDRAIQSLRSALVVLVLCVCGGLAVAQDVAAPVAATPSPTPGFGGEDGLYRFVVIGDFLAKGLGAGLTRQATADPRFEVENRFNEASGLARSAFYDWPSAAARLLDSSSYEAVVVMIGTNDRREIREGTLRLMFGTPDWKTAYAAQVDALLAAVSAKGARVYWVSPPPMAEATFDADMQLIAAIQQARVAAAGGTWIDLRKPLSKPDGSYADSAETPEGFQRIRLRDGIGFLRLGNDVLAGVVMPQIVAGAGAAAPKPAPTEAAGQARAVAPDTGPVFGQPGLDDAAQSFEAASVVVAPPKAKAAPEPAAKKPPGLGFVLVPGSAAERFYLKGDAGTAPAGRFDDYVAPETATAQ